MESQNDLPPKAKRHLVEGNALRLLPGGEERLDALIALIEGARERVDLCFYIFANDQVGQQIVAALVSAQSRGVAVRLMIDAFGSAFTPQSLFEPLIEAGGVFARFGARRSTRYLIRNHQKMVIADGYSAMIGGFNCEALYFAPFTQGEAWCDLALLVEGPIVEDLQRWYDSLLAWTTTKPERFRQLRLLVRTWEVRPGKVGWLMGGPTRLLNSWARQVKTDLRRSRRLDLVAAYFSPSASIIRRISAIARQGSARLIVTERSDNRATVGAARYLYLRLLRSGVSIFEYAPQKLHMKLIVIDDVVYIGSANFDMRSLFINLELMLRIEDQCFATEARELVDWIAGQSNEIHGRAYAAMSSPLNRLRWWIDYLLVGVLDYTVTRRLNFRRR